MSGIKEKIVEAFTGEKPLSPEAKVAEKGVEVALRQLKNEGRDEADADDCSVVLNACQAWIDELEFHGVPDSNKVLTDTREFMAIFVPTHAEDYKIRMKEKMGEGYE